MSSKNPSTTTAGIEASVANAQTNTGAPNDQRAAAASGGNVPHVNLQSAAARTAPLGTHTDGDRGDRQTHDLSSPARDGGEFLDERDGQTNERDVDRAARVNAAAQHAGKQLHEDTPTVDTATLLAKSNPGTPLAGGHGAAPVIHAPTVTPKGKLGYMATPSLPEGGAAPGVNQGGPQKPDFFTKPIVETSVTKGSKVDGRDGAPSTGEAGASVTKDNERR